MYTELKRVENTNPVVELFNLFKVRRGRAARIILLVHFDRDCEQAFLFSLINAERSEI